MANWQQSLRGVIGSQLGADVVEYNIEKAIREAEKTAKAAAKPASLFYDPYSLFFGREWLLKAGSPLTFQDLRQMAKNPIIGSIIQTRLNQVAAFCQPSNGGYQEGFEIDTRGGLPETNKYAKAREEMASFIQSAGFEGYGDDTLEMFARKFIRDSLVLDQACAEIVPRYNKLPAYIAAIDGGTVRRLQSSLTDPFDKESPKFCQVIDEVITAQYRRDQLIYGIRNPSTDIRHNGYGNSELELLITVITTLSNAEKYNSTSLSQGGTQKGVLVIKGDVDEPQLELFKQDFRSAIQNAARSWRPPVIRVGSDASVDWLPIDRSNKDMEYSQLFEFIVKLATGVYQISPEEVNWQVGISGTSVSYSSSAKSRLEHSQSKGLRPLLTFLSSTINARVVRPLNPDLEMTFTGLGVSPQEEADLREKEVTSYKTLNEVRAEANLPPIDGGDIVLNPVFAQLRAVEKAPVAVDGQQGKDANSQGKSADPTQDTGEDSFDVVGSNGGLHKSMLVDFSGGYF